MEGGSHEESMGMGTDCFCTVCALVCAGRSARTAVVFAPGIGKGGERVTRAEKRLAVAYCRHTVGSVAPGDFACYCGCGYRGGCRHCVPHAPVDIPWILCAEAKALVESGQARAEEGHVY